MRPTDKLFKWKQKSKKLHVYDKWKQIKTFLKTFTFLGEKENITNCVQEMYRSVIKKKNV